MAIMVIGLGMLVLFGLFPAGLREGENALINTHCALFADAVFNGLRSEAATKTWSEWKEWNNTEVVKTSVRRESTWAEVSGQRVGAGRVQSVNYPTNDETIWYIMEVGGSETNMNRSVWLWAQSAKHATDSVGKFKAGSMRFRCGYFYSSGKNE